MSIHRSLADMAHIVNTGHPPQQGDDRRVSIYLILKFKAADNEIRIKGSHKNAVNIQ